MQLLDGPRRNPTTKKGTAHEENHRPSMGGIQSGFSRYRWPFDPLARLLMSATKKDFETVAAAIREIPEESCLRQKVATVLADAFIELNPRFDRARFYRAAGLPEHCISDHESGGWRAYVNPNDSDPALFG